jgi:hypothetical protein
MQELENKKAALELLQNETNDKLNDYKVQISLLQKEIDDYNKPAITPEMMSKIEGAIEIAVDEFDFTDTDNYSYEPEFDYDHKVIIGNLELENRSDLVAEISEKVLELFKEADCPTDEDENNG